MKKINDKDDPENIEEIKHNLTPKQELFCHEYIKDLNATQACIRAGYSKKSARFIATQNLSKLYILQFISKLVEDRFKACDLKAEMIIQEYMKIAFSNVMDYFEFDSQNNLNLKPLNEMVNIAAVSDVNVIKNKSKQRINVRMHDKLHALDKLAEYLKIMKLNDQKKYNEAQVIFYVPSFNKDHLPPLPEELLHKNQDGTNDP